MLLPKSQILKSVIVAGISMASALAAQSASATEDPICGPRDSIVMQLNFGYGESSSAYGTTGNGMVAELFLSKEGSWTMVVTRPDGISCLMAAGKDWGESGPRPKAIDDAQQS